MGVTHTFASAIADDPADAASGKVLPSHWNAAHSTSIDLATEVSNAGFDYSDTQGITLLPATVGSGDSAAVLFHDTANSTGSGGYNWKLLYSGGNAWSNGPTGDANYVDDVWSMGLNIGSVVGTRADASKPSLALTMESKFYQGPAQLVPRSELHLETVDTSDVNHRFLSSEIAHDGSFSSVGFQATDINFKNNAGSQAIKFDFITTPAVVDHVIQTLWRFNTNNQPIVQQINAASNAYINLLYVNADDRLSATSGLSLVGPTPTTGSYANTFAAFVANSSGNNFVGVAVQTAPVTSGTYNFIKCQGSVDYEASIVLYNTNASGACTRYLAQNAAGSCDPITHYQVISATDWVVGIDNSDSDSFVIAKYFLPGTNNALRIDTSLNAAFGGNLSITTAANGQSLGIKSLTELLTIAAAATSTTTIQKPANSIILGVSVRVTTAVTCTSTFTVGDSGSATRFSTAAVSKAVNSTDKGTAAGAYYNATAEGIVITPDTTPSDATGRVRVTIYYLEVTPPTS